MSGIGNAFWTSPDRVHWVFHPQPSMAGNITGLAGTSQGYAAVGDTGTGNAAVWLSPDGVTWTAAPDRAAIHGATPDHPIGWVLASDGHASSNPSELLITVAGGPRAMVSSPIRPDP